MSNAIQYMEFSLNALASGERKAPHLQKNPAMAYLENHTLTGNIKDLEKAEKPLNLALGAIPSTHPQIYAIHESLGMVYSDYFNYTGDLHYLSLALDQYKLAVNLVPPGSLDVSFCKQNIATGYAARYRRLHDSSDLHLAIEYSAASLQKLSTNHFAIPLAKRNLARLLYDKFMLGHDMDDLNTAMKLQREALNVVSDTNPVRVSLLLDLASSHRVFFECTNQRAHLNATIPLIESYLNSATKDTLNFSKYHCRCASILQKFGEVTRDINLVNHAIDVCKAAVEFTRPNDPILPKLYTILGRSFLTLYHCSQDKNHFATLHYAYWALINYRISVSLSATPDQQIEAAMTWASFAMSLNLNKTLTAYYSALATLPNILWIGNSLGDRHNSLIRLNIPQLVSSAVAAAVKFNNIKCAVEFLEQGIAITYRQILELKDEPTHLMEKHPKIGLEFQKISMKLQEINNPFRKIKDDSHSLVIRQKDVINKIRTLPGFKDFLLPKLFEKLSEAAKYGPVILLNASFGGSQAIILLPSTHGSPSNPLLVPFPDATIANLKNHGKTLKKALEMHNISSREIGKRGKQSYLRSEKSHKMFKDLLSWLWEAIVKPVFDVLETVSNDFLKNIALY